MKEEDDVETDYLVVGAGAGGMVFADALLTHARPDGSAAPSITIVDRRDAPGGHWRDAYPFVRLHQPSAFYGIDSVPLGADAVDVSGTNAGFYELAGADELRAYFERVMHRHFLPTGRVRYFPSCEYRSEAANEHRLVSGHTGRSWRVAVRRKVVDTTYLAGEIPATTPPAFPIADGVRCVTPGELARLEPRDASGRFAILGGGKTALDTCVWLLERGVSPDAIRWVRPRDAWWVNRKFHQPGALLPDLYLGVALQIEAMAAAASLDDLFARLETAGFFLRLDPEVTPTMFRGAVTSEHEIDLLRQVRDVVRLGHVRAIERDAIVLDRGRVPTDARTIHVHCTARGLAQRPQRPIFEPGRVTVQPFFWGFACYQFATLGMIEATLGSESDEAKNRLCPPLSYWDQNEDYAVSFLGTLVGNRLRDAHPALAAWNKTSRLNPMSGLGEHQGDPRVLDARERIKRSASAAAANLQRLARPA